MTQRTAPPTVGSAGSAGELPADNNCIRHIREKAELGRRRAKYRHGRYPSRHRHVHRPAVIGNKYRTAADCRSQLAQTDPPHQIDSGRLTASLHVFDHSSIFAAAEKQDLATELFLA